MAVPDMATWLEEKKVAFMDYCKERNLPRTKAFWEAWVTYSHWLHVVAARGHRDLYMERQADAEAEFIRVQSTLEMERDGQLDGGWGLGPFRLDPCGDSGSTGFRKVASPADVENNPADSARDSSRFRDIRAICNLTLKHNPAVVENNPVDSARSICGTGDVTGAD